MNRFYVRQQVLDAIVEHAMRDQPDECCGLLIASDTTVVEAVPVRNEAAEPQRRYVIPPADYFREIKRCRASGTLAVVGAYHSHPRSAPEPSPTDLREAFESFLYLIVGPLDGSAAHQINAYRLSAGTFEAVPLVPSAGG
jgi:proteasome lid subunit RPN8/RPN11